MVIWAVRLSLIPDSFDLQLPSSADFISLKSWLLVLRGRPNRLAVSTVPQSDFLFKIESSVNRGSFES